MSINKRKIAIIGAGHVGSHAGYALSEQGIADEIVFIDTDREKAKAQALDIFDATVYFSHSVKVYEGSYEDAADAQLIVIAVGTNPDSSKGQTRMTMLCDTVHIVKEVAEKIKASGFNGIVLSISNPADVIAQYVRYKLSFPANRVLSTSTTLDSARLRRAVSEVFGVDGRSVYAYALGEHGESQMVPWSVATIAGKPVGDIIKENIKEYSNIKLHEIADEGRLGGWKILNGKGSTEFGIAASIAEVSRAIFSDEKKVLPVSTLLNGEYGQTGVYASVPAIVGANGVEGIIELSLTKKEQEQFAASCKIMKENFEKAKEL